MKIKLSQSSKKNFEFDIKNKISKSSIQNEDKIKNKTLNINEFNENLENTKTDGNNNKKIKFKFIKEIEQPQKNKEDKNDIKIDKKKNIFSLENFNNLYKYFYTNNFMKNKILLKKIKYQKKETKRIKFNKSYIIFFYDIILKIIIFSQFIKCNKRKIELASSFINLKTKGSGNIKIFSNNNGVIGPNNVSINNIDSELKNIYHFNNQENDINNIILIWDNPPSSTNNLFNGCNKIIEIDLSNFDSSNVINMENMFYGCSSLTSVNLSNFDTSQVNNMNLMFYE